MDISPKLKKTLLALTVVGFTSPAVLAAGDSERDRNADQTTSQQPAVQQGDTTDRDAMGAAGTEGTMGSGTSADETRTEWGDDNTTDRRTQPYNAPAGSELNERDSDNAVETR